jgi:hypothetical protein
MHALEVAQEAQLGLGILQAFLEPAIVVQPLALLQDPHIRGQVLDPLLPGVAFRARFSNIEFAMIAMYDVGTVIHDEYNVGSINPVPRSTYSLG